LNIFVFFQNESQDHTNDQNNTDKNSFDDDSDPLYSNDEDGDFNNQTTAEFYEDNFQVGIDIVVDENSTQSTSRPDPCIGMIIQS